jgi:hypothetical protein
MPSTPTNRVGMGVLLVNFHGLTSFKEAPLYQQKKKLQNNKKAYEHAIHPTP